ncbi:MAG: hypothetical protein M1484_01075 [Patescibacteria group bacterium]|nr:hypothetical protein [Patescibacteria group bacterium]MCL5431672.1 hypothetical protein [Patescibacteria group bacterium]
MKLISIAQRPKNQSLTFTQRADQLETERKKREAEKDRELEKINKFFDEQRKRTPES